MAGLFTYESTLRISVIYVQSVELYTCAEKFLNLAHFAKSE